jgi:hypothetical protein
MYEYHTVVLMNLNKTTSKVTNEHLARADAVPGSGPSTNKTPHTTMVLPTYKTDATGVIG